MISESLLLIESTVFIEASNDIVLFYNSIDGKKVLSNNKEIYLFFRNIDKLTHIYTINDHELNSDSFKELIESLEKNSMGRIIINSKTPPVQFYPMPKVNVLTEAGINDSESDKCLKYLNELSIYLDTFHPSAPSVFSYACKQTLCHYQSKSIKETMDIGFLLDVLSNIADLKFLNKLNILGGDIINIFETKKIRDSLTTLSQRIEVNLHFNYFASMNIEKANKIHHEIKHLKFKYCIASHLKNEDIENIKKLSLHDYVDFICLCENANDVLFYEELFFESKANFQLIPIYNGCNYNFFYENVFLDLEDIMAININQVEVQKNIALNTTKFGKLYILPNAGVFSDLNSTSIGNLKNADFSKIVYNEIYYGDNWFKTRLSVNPCKSCVFCIICPPISNYEHAFQRYNLCNIKNIEQLNLSNISNS